MTVAAAPSRCRMAAGRRRWRRLLAVLDRDGEEARIVGGAVRNALLGEPVGDIDIATTAVPQEVIRRVAGRRLQAGADRHRARHRHRRRRRAAVRGDHACARTSRPSAATPRSRSAATGGAMPSAAISPSTRCRRRATARSTIMSAGSPTSRSGACASSAMPARASPRTICASCASSASTPPTASGAPDPAGVAACIAGRAGLDQLSRERVRMELIKLLARRASGAVVRGDGGSRLARAGARRRAAAGERAQHDQARSRLALAPDPVRRLGRARASRSSRMPSACASACG